MKKKKESKPEGQLYPIAKLKAAPYNPRDITEAAFEGLKSSIQRFGMPQPVVVNRRNHVIVGGHARLKAAQALGWDQVPVIWVDLNEIEEKALNVALNSPVIQGHFTDSLQDILEEIRTAAPQDFGALLLEDLAIPDVWDQGRTEVDKTQENLDGIKALIRVSCEQEMKPKVIEVLKTAILEAKLDGVEIG